MAYYVAYTLRQYVKAIPGAAQTIPEADGNGKGGSMSTTFVLVNALARMICYYHITISRFVSLLRTFFLGFMQMSEPIEAGAAPTSVDEDLSHEEWMNYDNQ